jgi:DNA-binding NarL/FixJ family response regulator
MISQEKGVAVLLVHERRMVSELYAKAFNHRPRFRVVAQVRKISEAVRVVQESTVDVALISSTLKDGADDGLGALPQIRAASPNVKLIVLLEESDNRVAILAFRGGADGVISPAIDGFNCLCRCVEQVNAGQVWANSVQLHQVLEEFSRRASVQVVGNTGEALLTKREEEIVHLVEDGLTNRQIAVRLGLSEHTVRNNLFRIFDKLGVSTRVELALYTTRHSRLAPVKEHAVQRTDSRVSTRKKDTVTEIEDLANVSSRLSA